ncbi:zinc ribbon domain-containing protein [Acetivibrio cellulolyticus]|uniref:zinc ribbon domain-containing protein n=1 Tax=Acetivibrio cellulolyticus TaxID=35830 RepID=UPI0001E2D4F1|nr:zinc ribbon domain-containing protein [Acetivibrio cellulolyticus]
MFDELFDEILDDRHTHRHSCNKTDVTYAKLDALEAKSKAREASTEVTYLKLKVEKLMIITEALWMILKETTKHTDEELKEKIRQIDLKDGKLDGKVAAELPDKCPKCGQILQKNKLNCIYCGAEIISTDVFKR